MTTTVGMSWLAEHLAVRSADNVSQQLWRKPEAEKATRNVA
jgi:hypothetical protein